MYRLPPMADALLAEPEQSGTRELRRYLHEMRGSAGSTPAAPKSTK
jgi:hypothetical protein